MAQRSRSSCLHALRRKASVAALLSCVALMAACSSTGPADRPVFERWPATGSGATSPYLLALREYLAEPAGRQAAHRKRLQTAAASGSRAAELEYAFALSVDRDDRASLEMAREHFETLLAAPDPLPVALDALVRLQLGQVIDRLERMQASGDIHHAYRAAATERKVCQVNLEDRTRELHVVRAELEDVQHKLRALANIELNDDKQDGETSDGQEEQ